MTTIVGEELCEAVDVVPGERVLDVAAGSGNGALVAARRTRGSTVGVDYVPELLEHGRGRAAAEGDGISGSRSAGGTSTSGFAQPSTGWK